MNEYSLAKVQLFLLTIFFSILCYFHFNPFKLMWQWFLFLNGLFRLHIPILSCVLYKSQPSSKKDSPRTSD